jgi:YegS/Rv2252/BmrU family lipid kinase
MEIILMKHEFIVNPAAGKGRALKFIPVIKSFFCSDNGLCENDYSINFTEYPGHAALIAENLIKNGAERIYSVGGDGTLNEVINGLSGSDVTIGVIPAGSGNDFIRSLIPAYVSRKRNTDELKDFLKKTITAKTQLFDIAQANGRYFINASSMGFDAEVANTTNVLKRKYPIPLKFAYIAGILRSILRNYKRNIEIEIDGRTINKTVLMVVIANGKFYGNGIPIAPGAKPDDGMLDICVIDWCTRIRILTVLPEVMKGMIESLHEFTHFYGKNIRIHSEETLFLNFDGEISTGNDVIFNLCNFKIKVAVPDLSI